MNEVTNMIAQASEDRLNETIERVNFVGRLTGWRNLKNNKRRSQIISGNYKMQQLLARFKA